MLKLDNIFTAEEARILSLQSKYKNNIWFIEHIFGWIKEICAYGDTWAEFDLNRRSVDIAIVQLQLEEFGYKTEVVDKKLKVSWK